MSNIISKIKSARNYLSYQIFASFWLTFAILLGIAVALPNLDARSFSPVEDAKHDFFFQESLNTEQEYNLDEIFNRELLVTTKKGFDVILLHPITGSVRGVDNRYMNLLQAFILKANDPEEPLERRFVDVEFIGPYIVRSSTQEYYQYFMHHVDPQREIVNLFFDSPWLMLAIFLVISSPILLWLSWKIAKPVKALRLAANAVATGNLTIDPKLEIETKGILELHKVATSFNHMITALRNLRSYQQGLLSDISHELKTPLTRMQLAVSLIRRRYGESNELTRIENEIEKLNTMILDLLALSRQQFNHSLVRDVFSINKIWDDILEDAHFETEQNGIDLFVSQRISFPERYFINGNVTMLSSAVENVIRNAQKYAKHSIKMMTYIDKTELHIIVDDDGAGVPEGEYDKIFRPFYRVDQDRARQTGGTGLGLAIVTNAIQQHKGAVSASKSPLGGLRVEIRLPLWIE